MGIDPVTHAPRLDLLDMSSIIRLALGYTSLLNLQSLLGTQGLVNPDLLKLVATATLLSSMKNETPKLVSHNLQQINAGNFQVQNQVAPSQEFVNQFPAPIQTTNVNDSSSNMMNMSSSSSPENSVPSYLGEDLISQQNEIDLFQDPELLRYLNNATYQNTGKEAQMALTLRKKIMEEGHGS